MTRLQPLGSLVIPSSPPSGPLSTGLPSDGPSASVSLYMRSCETRSASGGSFLLTDNCLQSRKAESVGGKEGSNVSVKSQNLMSKPSQTRTNLPLSCFLPPHVLMICSALNSPALAEGGSWDERGCSENVPVLPASQSTFQSASSASSHPATSDPHGFLRKPRCLLSDSQRTAQMIMW